MRRILITLSFSLLIAACRGEPEPDAYGNVETTEVVVSAEASGQITAFGVNEGDRLAAGQHVGVIEATTLALEEEQIRAQRQANAGRLDEIAQQIDALQVQRVIARRSYERTRRLVEQRAATARELDQAERDYRVLNEQIEGAQAQQQSIRLDLAAADARVAQVRERISKSRIVNPVGGTVLAVYARTGEVTQTGKPLYRIADMRTMEVRAYVTGTQLGAVRVGQRANVSVDASEDQRHVIAGTVTWVSPDAEFTPTPIQTREESAGLVYAVKIRVPNPNGVLKIGMPAEVEFPAPV